MAVEYRRVLEQTSRMPGFSGKDSQFRMAGSELCASASIGIVKQEKRAAAMMWNGRISLPVLVIGELRSLG